MGRRPVCLGYDVVCVGLGLRWRGHVLLARVLVLALVLVRFLLVVWTQATGFNAFAQVGYQNGFDDALGVVLELLDHVGISSFGRNAVGLGLAQGAQHFGLEVFFDTGTPPFQRIFKHVVALLW